jgi:hypothetical protein
MLHTPPTHARPNMVRYPHYSCLPTFLSSEQLFKLSLYRSNIGGLEASSQSSQQVLSIVDELLSKSQQIIRTPPFSSEAQKLSGHVACREDLWLPVPFSALCAGLEGAS